MKKRYLFSAVGFLFCLAWASPSILSSVPSHAGEMPEISVGVDFKRTKSKPIEDRHIALTDPFPIWGVFDGHKGYAYAEHLKNSLPRLLVAEIGNPESEPEDHIAESITKAFNEAASSFTRNKRDRSGSTAIVVCALSSGDKKKLYSANVGDSRAMLVKKDGRIIELSSDHTIRNEEERKRVLSVKASDPTEEPLRKKPRLAISKIDDGENSEEINVDKIEKRWLFEHDITMTRVFGHRGLIHEPEVRSFEISSDFWFAVIASDGFWDNVSNLETSIKAIGLLEQKEKKPQDIAHDLLVFSARKNATNPFKDDPSEEKVLSRIHDDMTVVFVLFH